MFRPCALYVLDTMRFTGGTPPVESFPSNHVNRSHWSVQICMWSQTFCKCGDLSTPIIVKLIYNVNNNIFHDIAVAYLTYMCLLLSMKGIIRKYGI